MIYAILALIFWIAVMVSGILWVLLSGKRERDRAALNRRRKREQREWERTHPEEILAALEKEIENQSRMEHVMRQEGREEEASIAASRAERAMRRMQEIRRAQEMDS
jgi:hypothetical protein